MKKQKKNKQFYKIILIGMILLLSFLFPNFVQAKGENNSSFDQNTILEQQENFGISTFLENAEEYTGDFFNGTDMKELLNSAIQGKVDNQTIYQKILSVLGTEVQSGIKSLIGILAIIVIHSILKSVSESLENDNISKLIYYVQYIAIVTIIMVNFSDIISLVKTTSSNLVGFMNSLVPILVSLMMYTGSIATSSILEPIILFMINFIGNLIETVLIPLTFIIAALSILSKLSDQISIERITKFLKSGVVWFLGILLTVFVGVVSLEGTLSSSVDGITAKTTKAIVSSAIPVVGKILGDAVDTVLGCGIILKNAVGVIGVIIVISICILPILKLSVLTICYKLLASVTEPIADGKIVKLLDQMGDIFKILLGILSAISVMVIIGTTLVIKISNSGMMYR